MMGMAPVGSGLYADHRNCEILPGRLISVVPFARTEAVIPLMAPSIRVRADKKISLCNQVVLER